MRARGRVAGLGLSERRHLRATDKPTQIVPRTRIVEVDERVDRSGEVLESLDLASARRAVEALLVDGVESFAVSLLWAHVNPAHERRIRELVAELSPASHVSLASEVAPVTGEYERASTTVVNAYVAPTLERYLGRVQHVLQEAGLRVPILVFQAGGGVSTVASVLPVSTIESGPAGGMVAAADLATRLELPRAIATDVGGTTFKVGLVVDGRWSMAPETIINQYALQSPMVDVVSIGAGGGSIAWVDNGRLRIGPASAGADPGPACYGWGGELPTVTDADLLLGMLDPARFLNGRMALDAGRAASAMQPVADELFAGDVIAAAAGVRQVVDSHMGDLIRKATLERGFDPRDFAVIAYGGAGPVHAASYARAAGAEHVVIPHSATIFSAHGIVVSDAIRILQRSVPSHHASDERAILALYDELIAAARAEMRLQGIHDDQIATLCWADMRYERQLHDVRVDLGAEPPSLSTLHREFTGRYDRLYGPAAHALGARPRVIRVGVEAIAANDLMLVPVSEHGGEVPPTTERRVFWPELGDWAPTRVYDLTGPDATARDIVGPAIIDQPATCVVVPPGARAHVDRHRNVHVDLTAARPADGKAEK
jgi:N-methylhydantoinase A